MIQQIIVRSSQWVSSHWVVSINRKSGRRSATAPGAARPNRALPGATNAAWGATRNGPRLQAGSESPPTARKQRHTAQAFRVACSFLFALLAQTSLAVEATWEYAVQVSASAQAAPPQITLAWPQDTALMPSTYSVYRKAPDATSWAPVTVLAGTATSFTDLNVAVGTAYEYQIVKATSGYTGYGYILTGINTPLVESRGKLVLVVDNTQAAALAPELGRLQQDLAGDGWTVLRHDVSPTDPVTNVKALIRADYNADPANVKAVFLFGHVPVPYSGDIVPDGHNPEHRGAWPADVYYGDMDGNWTDTSVNSTGAVEPRNRNVPGDGKFDQSTLPSSVELQVGRVDLSNMPGRTTWGGPATFPSERDLLRQYLNKDHDYRHKRFALPQRGLVGDYFGIRGGEAFAASGYRNFAPFFGAANIANLNTLYNDAKGVWISTLQANAYLWAYGCGAGSYTTVGGLGNTGLYNDGSTIEFVGNDIKAAFVSLFGSWLGDWDTEDNILRAVLATRSYGLASFWSGRPHWFVHPMGLGETIGQGARLTQNNSSGLYRNQANTAAGSIHVALMGDPTLRLHTVAPASSLGGSVNAGAVSLAWLASADAVLGYNVYRAATPAGPFTRLNSSLIGGTAFTDATAGSSGYTYMVRAVKLESTPSGNYYNASQGAFWTVGGTPLPAVDSTPPSISLIAPANGATVAGTAVTVSANASDNVGVVGVQFKLDGANLGAEILSAPYTITWNTTTAANGSHTLSAVARDLAGNQATASTVAVTVSNGSASTVVWVEDALPAGAGGSGSGGDAWTWTNSNPAPFSGAFAHQSALAAGLHEHAFSWASQTLTISTNDVLFTYVYLDPANPPSELMLSWSADNWEHRAYWGANNITYGADGTASRRYVGSLPAAGQWVRLEVPAADVGLEGQTLTGMSFSLYNGRATWDYTGKSAVIASAPATPTVSVVATDAMATIGTSDNALLTFTRVGDTSGALTVNYTLGGTAVKWIDYRTPAGDMPVAVTIPAGAATVTMTIVGVTNSTGANPLAAVLTLAPDAAYLVGTPGTATLNLLGGSTTNPPPVITNTPPQVSAIDGTTLQLPKVGDTTLHVLSPTLLELHLINTKQPAPATVTNWNFVDATGNFIAPALTEFAVTVDGVSVGVQSVGFKRRPLYAPLVQRDLRIDNCLYLQLAVPIADNQSVQVLNPSGLLWGSTVQYAATANPLRYSPAIHVNQEGYVPSFPKKAMVGYYAGSLGEMTIPASTFQIVDVATGAQMHQGSLTLRADVGYSYTPAPYQKVYEADFSSFTTPGEYRLVVPGLGASLAFVIDDGVAMAFTRAYALGLYHQRCGMDNALPFTRCTHDACHLAPADVPLPQASFPFTWNTVSNYALISNADNPPQIAPKLTSPAAQLYPFVRTGTLDTSGGHHDAGDYSKYTINSASLIHYLMFAVDSLPGVAALDNLGLPESGDGISDVLQEAKWEADYLAKIQDSDGGFYFLVYPQNREYESNVLPDRGDPQVVWPKTTSVTAAGVAALAQCASSPLMKQKYPAAAALYLQKAQLGWQFLTNAIALHGKDGAYQKITHYGDDFSHNDELAWAASEMFVATGDPAIHQTLKTWFPDPSDPATFRWGWWRLYASYGNAVRSYAFAARSGRLPASQLDAAYLSKCETTVTNAGNDALTWSREGAYGSSFPNATKRVRGAGWYFSTDQAFDIAVAYQLSARPEFVDAMVANMNYEGGCNPVNVTYVTGLGWKRQREIVDQYSQNDRRLLPKSGIPLGNIQQGFVYVGTYGTELRELTFPSDDAATAPYPYYDRWADTFNVATEFVVLNQARGLGTLAFLATLTPVKTQAWTSATAQITGLPAQVSTNTPVTATLQVAGLDLSGTRIVWEAQGQEPAYGTSFTFTPSSYGGQWVEVEAQWPDGRRVFAATNLFASNSLPTVTISSTDASATEGATDTASFTLTRTGSTASDLIVTLQPAGTATKWIDYRRPQGDMPEFFTIPAGASSATITVLAVDDAEVEGTETATLTLQSDANYNVGSPYYTTLTILDNDGTPPPADTSAPTVSITAPANNATVSGSAVSVSANASDNVGVVGVQFKLDGANLSAEDASAPYSVTLDTTTIADGSHTLTAVARDAAGNQATATPITIVVSNTAPLALPTVTVGATDASASRVGPDPGTLTFTRTGSTSASLTVNYTLSGTAVNGTDYASLAGTAIIPAGAASIAVTVTPLAATNLVGSMTVIVTVASDASYTIGSTNSASVTIAGNSVPVSSIRKVGGGIRITWASVAGKTYRVTCKDSLSDPAWTDLSGNVTATGSSTSWTDASSGASKNRFFVVYVTN